MGEKIPHSFLLVAEVIQAKRQELRNNGRFPIMHKSEYEALVLDTIKNDTLDIEDTNDLVEVTQFMHERGERELSYWFKKIRPVPCHSSQPDVSKLKTNCDRLTREIPCLATIAYFPALGTRCMFSRPFYPLHISPRLTPVARFSFRFPLIIAVLLPVSCDGLFSVS